MPTLVKRKCDYCNQEYVGSGKKYCSKEHAMLAKESETIKKLNEIDSIAKKLTGNFQITGDWMVTSDWHLPLIDTDIVLRMILIAKKFNIKNLAIVGDFVDFESISLWEHKNRNAEIRKDLDAATQMLDVLFDWFDKIYWSFGNHDDRLSRLFNFALQPSEFGRLITDQIGKKLFISSHPYMELENGSTWRLTHPKNFSIITGRVPAKLAEKYRCNVLGAHGHHLGFCFDVSGHDLCGDLGCMCDSEKTHYIMFNDTTHPRWNKGFGMIRNGTYYQFSANHKATDWNFWLGDMTLSTNNEVANKGKKIIKRAAKKTSKTKKR